MQRRSVRSPQLPPLPPPSSPPLLRRRQLPQLSVQPHQPGWRQPLLPQPPLLSSSPFSNPPVNPQNRRRRRRRRLHHRRNDKNINSNISVLDFLILILQCYCTYYFLYMLQTFLYFFFVDFYFILFCIGVISILVMCYVKSSILETWVKNIVALRSTK
jgi:hypothetical protein